MTGPAIQVRGLTKTYGKVVAVDEVSFAVERGEIFGLLGPNGAGKTTTLEILEGLRAADEGELSVLGINPGTEPGRLYRVIGVQLQSAAWPAEIRVREAMALVSAYRRCPYRMDLLERLGVSGLLDREYGRLSGGQQRRLQLCLAVAHDPQVLFLDEPTAGLDVESRADLHHEIRELRERGCTVLLSTHDMAEAEQMSDRVAILLQGRLAAVGTPRELTASGGGSTRISVRTAGGGPEPGVAFSGVTSELFRDGYRVYFTTDPGPAVAAIIAHIGRTEDTLIDLRVERPSLEDRFLEITRGGNRS